MLESRREVGLRKSWAAKRRKPRNELTYACVYVRYTALRFLVGKGGTHALSVSGMLAREKGKILEEGDLRRAKFRNLSGSQGRRCWRQ